MPYIEHKRRWELSRQNYIASNAGELNYCFTSIINDYINARPWSYKRFNDVIGALEGAKLEFYRRIVAPYEDKKMEENGDVY